MVGVAIHDGSVLLHRADHESFWTLPGGRVEHGETAEQTVKREMQEELETDVDVVRLLWLVENFFEYDGRRYHEIALYFLIRFPDNSLPRTSAAFDRNDGRRASQIPVASRPGRTADAIACTSRVPAAGADRPPELGRAHRST